MTIHTSAITPHMHAASAATMRMRTRSTESHLTILGTLSPSTQQPCKGYATNHRLLADTEHRHPKVLRSAPELDHVPFRMCGCTASFKPGGPRLDVLYTRPVKPRQSGRTILIRSAKQYISFHMPTQTTSNKRRAVAVTLLSAKLTTDRLSSSQSS